MDASAAARHSSEGGSSQSSGPPMAASFSRSPPAPAWESDAPPAPAWESDAVTGAQCDTVFQSRPSLDGQPQLDECPSPDEVTALGSAEEGVESPEGPRQPRAPLLRVPSLLGHAWAGGAVAVSPAVGKPSHSVGAFGDALMAASPVPQAAYAEGGPLAGSESPPQRDLVLGLDPVQDLDSPPRHHPDGEPRTTDEDMCDDDPRMYSFQPPPTAAADGSFTVYDNSEAHPTATRPSVSGGGSFTVYHNEEALLEPLPRGTREEESLPSAQGCADPATAIATAQAAQAVLTSQARGMEPASVVTAPTLAEATASSSGSGPRRTSVVLSTFLSAFGGSKIPPASPSTPPPAPSAAPSPLCSPLLPFAPLTEALVARQALVALRHPQPAFAAASSNTTGDNKSDGGSSTSSGHISSEVAKPQPALGWFGQKVKEEGGYLYPSAAAAAADASPPEGDANAASPKTDEAIASEDSTARLSAMIASLRGELWSPRTDNGGSPSHAAHEEVAVSGPAAMMASPRGYLLSPRSDGGSPGPSVEADAAASHSPRYDDAHKEAASEPATAMEPSGQTSFNAAALLSAQREAGAAASAAGGPSSALAASIMGGEHHDAGDDDADVKVVNTAAALEQRQRPGGPPLGIGIGDEHHRVDDVKVVNTAAALLRAQRSPAAAAEGPDEVATAASFFRSPLLR